MGRTVRSVGQVIEGDFAGKNIYCNDDTNYMIISRDEGGKIIVASLFPTRFDVLQEITRETLERLVLISDAVRMYRVALYFKNGKKCIVEIGASHYSNFQQMTFKL